MAKYDVDIKVLYNDLVVVELPDNATRDQIVAAAEAKYKEDVTAEYMLTILGVGRPTWTINKQGSEGLAGPVISVERSVAPSTPVRPDLDTSENELPES